jgi:hypothetical protein
MLDLADVASAAMTSPRWQEVGAVVLVEQHRVRFSLFLYNYLTKSIQFFHLLTTFLFECCRKKWKKFTQELKKMEEIYARNLHGLDFGGPVCDELLHFRPSFA